MKTIRQFLRKFCRMRNKSRAAKAFTSLVFEYTIGNPKLNQDQRQLLEHWLYSLKDSRDMTVLCAVRIARWLNVHVNGFSRDKKCAVFEEVPA